MDTRNELAVAAVMGAIFLAGCAASKFERASIANSAKQSLVGMSRKDLLSCAGVPARQATDGATEFLTYAAGGDSVGGAVVAPNNGVAVGVSKHRYCEATFVLENGVVTKVNYAGRTGGYASQGEQCYYVVENCVAPK